MNGNQARVATFTPAPGMAMLTAVTDEEVNARLWQLAIGHKSGAATDSQSA